VLHYIKSMCILKPARNEIYTPSLEAGQDDVYICKRKGQLHSGKGILPYYSTFLHAENNAKIHDQECQG